MRFSRARFKRALRQCRAMENSIREEKRATQLANCDMKNFWKGIKSDCARAKNPSSLGNVEGDQAIADYWGDHFENVLNSVSTNNDFIDNVKKRCLIACLYLTVV